MAFYPIGKNLPALLYCLVSLNLALIAQSSNTFQYIGKLSENKAAFSQNGKYGYLNEKGQVIIPCKFDSAGNFVKGFAVVKEGRAFGLIYEYGAYAIAPDYDFLNTPDRSGFIYAIKSNKVGILNTQGKVIVPFEYENTGIAEDNFNGFIRLKKGKYYGYKGITGWDLIPFKYCYFDNFNKHMLAKAKSCTNEKYFLLDRNGHLNSSEDMDDIFYDRMPCIGKIKDRYFYFDTSYQPAVKHGPSDTTLSFEWADYFYGKYALVMQDKNYFFVDRSRVRNSDLNFDDHKDFSEGLIFLKKNGKWAAFDSNARKVTKFEFDDAGLFRNGYATVMQNGLTGLVNKNGKTVITCEHEEIQIVNDKFVMIRKGDKWAFASTQGKLLTTYKYDYLPSTRFQNEVAIVSQKGKYGLLNSSGIEIIKSGYDKIEFISNDLIAAYKNNAASVLSVKTGKCALLCK